MSWYLYLLECRGGRIYTGITVDVESRVAAHRAGKGAKFTRAYPPTRLLATRPYPDRSEASKAEYAVKRLTAAGKRQLCQSLGGTKNRDGKDSHDGL